MEQHTRKERDVQFDESKLIEVKMEKPIMEQASSEMSEQQHNFRFEQNSNHFHNVHQIMSDEESLIFTDESSQGIKEKIDSVITNIPLEKFNEESTCVTKMSESYCLLASSSPLSSSSSSLETESLLNSRESEIEELQSASCSSEDDSTPPLVYDFSSYPHCPIYIPSKGRYEQERGTISNLVKELIPFTVVVEPAEANHYICLVDHLVYKYFGPGGMCCPSNDNDSHAREVANNSTDKQIKMNEKNDNFEVYNSERSEVQYSCDHEESAASIESNTPTELEEELCDCKYYYKKQEACYRNREIEENCTNNNEEKFSVLNYFQEEVNKLYHLGYNLLFGSLDIFRQTDSKAKDNHNVLNNERTVAENCYCNSTHEQQNNLLNENIKLEEIEASISTNEKEAKNVKNVNVHSNGKLYVNTIEEIRSLFTIAVLPENNKGVAYVRNYILQILVPQQMIACGLDKTGHVDELNLFTSHESKLLNDNALKAMNLDKAVYESLRAYQEFSPTAPHNLLGFYWVLDDDIYVLYRTDEKFKRNIRITFRDMMSEVGRRISVLRGNSSQPPFGKNINCAKVDSKVRENNLNFINENQSTILNEREVSTFGGITTHSAINSSQAIFSCREACFSNNEIKDRVGNIRGNVLSLNNYNYYDYTACYSLEYSRFAFSYDDLSMAVNSYNTIACLFNYNLLHSPARQVYFPPNLTTGVRSVKDVLSAGWCITCDSNQKDATYSYNNISTATNNNNNNNNNNINNVFGAMSKVKAVSTVGVIASKNALVESVNNSALMMWYRYAVREDYDFTLQLIARGYLTVRFRNLSFEVPQMSKIKGGMTEYYKTCVTEMQEENKHFVEQWPAISQHWVKGKNVTQRDDIKVRWDLLHPSRTRYPGAYLYLRYPLPSLQPQRRFVMNKVNHETTIIAKNNDSHSANIRSIAHAPEGVTVKAKEEERCHESKSPTMFINEESANNNNNNNNNYSISTVNESSVTREMNANNEKNLNSINCCKAEFKRARDGEKLSYVPNIDNTIDTVANKKGVCSNERKNLQSERTATATTLSVKLENNVRSIDGHSNNNNNSSSNWKGYLIEQWRDITDEEACRLGLNVLEPSSLRAGQSVAVILPFFSQNPSVALAVLIEKSSLAREHCVRWNAVVQNVPGVAFLSVKKCYEVPINGIEAASRAVDNFFETLKESA